MAKMIVLYIITSATLALLGPGRFSLDWLLWSRNKGVPASQPTAQSKDVVTRQTHHKAATIPEPVATKRHPVQRVRIPPFRPVESFKIQRDAPALVAGASVFALTAPGIGCAN